MGALPGPSTSRTKQIFRIADRQPAVVDLRQTSIPGSHPGGASNFQESLVACHSLIDATLRTPQEQGDGRPRLQLRKVQMPDAVPNTT
jgi:hypothetical protein